jgi:type II secretory ATPase GspE/PulE/Tfp pilus assembly ATPase PilB-like protein
MSDLSEPPTSAVPQVQGAEARTFGKASQWPAPPQEGYPSRTGVDEQEPCELVGPTGGATRVKLIEFDLAKGSVQLQAPQARKPIAIRFDQFQRLVLLTPISPLPATGGQVKKFRPEAYHVTHKSGQSSSGLTLGTVELPAGLFLFEPIDEQASVRRVFIPRSTIARLDFGVDAEAHMAQAATPDATSPAEAAPATPAPAMQAPTTAAEPVRAGQPSSRATQVAEILSEHPATTPQELEEGIARQARMPIVRLGEALMALGFIDQAQLQAAIEEQRHDRGTPIGELLVRKGLVTREGLQTALARKMGYPVVDLSRFPADTEALVLINKALATRVQAMPLMVRQGRLIVAVDDPSRAKALDEIEFAAGCKVVPVLALTGTLPDGIDRAYQKLGAESLEARLAEAERSSSEVDYSGSNELLASLEQDSGEEAGGDEGSIEQSDNSLVRLINSMILEAQAQGVSDIHIESQPGRQKVKIRFRRDGVLKPYLELPHTYRSAMLARIKIMCDLDISERRKPQDGKITLGKFVNGSRLELRVATIPTSNGLEDAVLRLLSSAKLIPLEDIGMSPDNLARVKDVVQRPYGMFLCVGPTGSGKTTTLHSALGFINGPDRKIWTAEDPIEITQQGLRQVQVNPKIDWTFAKALRSFLRADPDVIMVGEIRDKETAQTAIESSLTGHLVLSTLHTNSAPETVTRLLDMGMDPFNFGDSLLGVLAQRLVRRMCPHCRTSRLATEEEIGELVGDYLNSFAEAKNRPTAATLVNQWLERFGMDRRDPSQRAPSGHDGVLVHYESPGCEKCGGTGYRGRAGIHELLMVTRDLRHLIQTGARVDDIQRAALEGSMRTLRQDGIEKVMAGITTIHEVRATTNA